MKSAPYAIDGRSDASRIGRLRCRPEKTGWQGRPLRPPRCDLRPQSHRRRTAGRQHRRHAQRGAVRQRDQGRQVPPRVVDRRRRPLRRRVARRHVRRGREPRPSLLRHQARLRRHRAQGMRDALARLPPRPGRRRFQNRRDGQGRRALLFLQADPEDAQVPAGVDADHRHRGRAHQHRAGRFRGRRDGPHHAHGKRRRPCLPPDRPEPAPGRRRAQHLLQGRACAAHGDSHQRGAVRLHPARHQEERDVADPGAPGAQRRDERPRTARRDDAVRQLPDALRFTARPKKP